MPEIRCPPSAAPAAAPLPLLPDLLSERVSPLRGRWFQRDLPYSWDFFMVRRRSTCPARVMHVLQCVTLTINAVVVCLLLGCVHSVPCHGRASASQGRVPCVALPSQ